MLTDLLEGTPLTIVTVTPDLLAAAGGGGGSLVLGSVSKKVQQCKPYVQHIESHAQHIERHVQHTECHAQGKMSLGAMFRVNDTRDGCFFEKRWILRQVHQLAGQSNGR